MPSLSINVTVCTVLVCTVPVDTATCRLARSHLQDPRMILESLLIKNWDGPGITVTRNSPIL